MIQFVLGPGKTSRHNPASFYQDREHLIKADEILRSKHGLQHIGEWHSHHQMGLTQPSGGDEQTVFNALRQYNFPKFLLCIANLRPQTEPIVISEDIWYSTPKGKALLKEIFDGLNNRYQNCEMFRTPDEDIYFNFENKHNRNTDKWRIELPHNFPHISPKVKVNHGKYASIKDWNDDSKQLEQIEACIERYYKGEWRN